MLKYSKIIILLLLFLIFIFLFIYTYRKEYFVNKPNKNEINILTTKLNHNKNSKDLVIGAYNYSIMKLKNENSGIKVFLDTLRKYNNDCCVIIICDIKNKSTILEKYLEETKSNVIYYKFDEKHFDDRFMIIYEILKMYKFNNIFISDLNDVILQDDPFKIKTENKIYCATEKSKILQDDFCGKINLEWIEKYYKINNITVNLKEKYDNKNVLCCGTIIGNYNSIMKYLKWYDSQNNNNRERIIGQGLFNVFCYDNPNDCLIYDTSNNKILTWGCGNNFSKIKKDKNNNLLDDNLEKYIIVHQYNRIDNFIKTYHSYI